MGSIEGKVEPGPIFGDRGRKDPRRSVREGGRACL